MSTTYNLQPGTTLGPLPENAAKLNKLVQLQSFYGTPPQLYTTHTFLINPESYRQTENARAQVVQTLGGGYVDLFGPALIQIQFSGTTGLQTKYVNGFLTDGYQRFQDLLGTIRSMWTAPIQFQTEDWHFFLWNWTDDQYFEVLPMQNSWVQAVPKQLVFYYDLTLIALQSLNTTGTTTGMSQAYNYLNTVSGYSIQNYYLISPAAAVQQQAAGN